MKSSLSPRVVSTRAVARLSILALSGVISLPAAYGQAKEPARATLLRAYGFAESQPVRELPPASKSTTPFRKEEEEKEEINSQNRERIRHIDPAAKRTADAALSSATRQKGQPAVLPGPVVSFDGVSAAQTVALGQGYIPPDTNGAVGPTQYVQTVNVAFRVWDKAGNPLTPVAALSSLFAPLGGPCSSVDDGDPIVMYDQLADRWIISQFCVSVTNPNNHQLIAVSKTGDAAGAYWLYDFMMPNNKFPDYPHLSVWSDGYYMTTNQFDQAGTAFLQAGVFAFERAKMLVGDPTASFVYFDTAVLFPPGTGINGTDGIGGMLPANVDGYVAPPAGAPCPFAYFQAGEFGDPGDQLRIFDFHADFAVPGNSTFTERTGSPLAVAAFDPIPVPNSRNVIPQPAPASSSSYLDAISDRLMFRLAYRNRGSSEVLLMNHTVNAAVNPSFRAGIRFYQLSRSSPASAFNIVEQQTYAGMSGDVTHRWMGSVAMNYLGDIALGFSASSSSMFPSIAYAAKLGTDAPGSGLVQGEQTIIAGAGAQTSSSGRWGDYSDMTVDPSDDCSFWYTQEYYAASSSGSWQTRIAKITPGPVSTSPRGTISGTITNCSTSQPVPNAFVQFTGGFARTTAANGTYSTTLAPGTYNATVSAAGYNNGTATGLTVVNGTNTTFGTCLTGFPVLAAGTTSITAESCAVNGAIDPNETVTVNFALTNNGGGPTSNLVATLQATGGVTSPSGPQNYGIVSPGGTVTRAFTFTAANVSCGAPIVATLQLQDGATNLGTATYNFSTGVLNVLSYSTGNIAVAIPDNNATGVDIPLTVSDAVAIADVNVSFRINHTYDGDLLVQLVHPDNTVVTLVSRRGGSGANFGTGTNDCSGTPTYLDDSATTGINAGVAPFAGSYVPDAPLSVLNGKQANGVWKLRVSDNSSQDTGTVGCFKLEINRRTVCCGALLSAAPPPVLQSENFSPANSAPDPGEYVTVNLPVQNTGGSDTVNLVGTLLSSSSVSAPSGAQNYGALVHGGAAVSRPFSFIANGTCGNNITLNLALQDGANNYGTVSYTMRLGGLSGATPSTENFDGVTAPALPTGWTTAATGGESPWVASTTNPVSAPNNVFAPDVSSVGTTDLVSPTLSIPADGGQITFKNLFNMEASSSGTTGYDGMVLEISINGGAYTDILTAGGSFVTGGYNRTISSSFGSALAGRQAWSYLSGGTTSAPTYITSTVNIPMSARGQPVKLRWRVATDSTAVASGLAGVRIDDVTVPVSSPVCVTNQAPQIVNGPPPSPIVVGAPYSYQFGASGNPAPTFTLMGTLPSGLSFTPQGLLAGTVTAGGSGSFPNIMVKASNSVNPDATQTFSLSTVTVAENYFASFGLTGANAALLFDFDLDGILNLLEYALQLDPTIASRLGLPVTTVKDYGGTKYLSMTFTRSSLATDITYMAQTSGDMSGWNNVATSTGGGPTSGAGFVSESGGPPNYTVEVRDTVPFNMATPGRRFIRLKVTKP